MDFFEEENQIQYMSNSYERELSIPKNPFGEQTIEWEAYNELLNHFKPNDEFMELLSECISHETHEREHYFIEMESLTW